MSKRQWMPFYIGDFLADTMHLGATERGIYISLIIHCWQHGSIPRDSRKLARIAACDSRLWHQYEETVLQFFDVVDASTMQHGRVITELHRCDEISSKRKGAAQQMHAQKRANAEQMHTQSQSHIEEERKIDIPIKEKGGRGSRLSEDWTPNEDDLAFARQTLKDFEISEETQKFRDYWFARAGPGAVKRDWAATWRNWVRNRKQFNATDRKELAKSASELAIAKLDAFAKRGANGGIRDPADEILPPTGISGGSGSIFDWDHGTVLPLPAPDSRKGD